MKYSNQFAYDSADQWPDEEPLDEELQDIDEEEWADEWDEEEE